jgi:hypothetical protein
VRACWTARLSSPSVGMCRWTMQWRVSRREVGSWRLLPGGNQEGRSRVMSIWVSSRPVMNLVVVR